MNLYFIRNTMTSQGKARIGDVLELPDLEGKSLIQMERCVLQSFETPLVNKSLGLEISDAMPIIKRGRPKKNV
jgi:hypothetical protein